MSTVTVEYGPWNAIDQIHLVHSENRLSSISSREVARDIRLQRSGTTARVRRALPTFREAVDDLQTETPKPFLLTARIRLLKLVAKKRS